MYKLGCRLLMINGIVFIVIGLFIVFFNDTTFFNIFNWLLNPIFNGYEKFSPGAIIFKNFAWTFIGMFHIIWGVFLFYIVRYCLMRKIEVWAWKSIFISVIVWLMIDIYFSLSTKLYRVTFNPVTIFFIAFFIIPLLMTKTALKQKDKVG